MTNGSSRRKRSKHEQQAAAAVDTSYPASVQLYFYGEHEDDDEACSCSAAEVKTMAAARTTAGHPIQVYFRFALPPEVSSLRVRFPDAEKKITYTMVMAAHGDSVLLQIRYEVEDDDFINDHFVYNAGAAAGPDPRPPTLSLLPPFYLSDEEVEEICLHRPRGPVHRSLVADATGFLRRGVMVAELKIEDVDDDKVRAELLRLCSGKWSIHRPTVNGQNRQRLSKWDSSTVLPLRDGLLCWLDESSGLLLCNVFDENPDLRYVPLPVEPSDGNLRVIDGGSAMKFINIVRRCCCGGKGTTDCHRSRYAYTIHTWTLRIEDMVWVMDGMVDSSEIWGLDAYEGLPHVPLVAPVVSMDDTHVISFEVCERNFVERGAMTVWLITLDLRIRTLLSACCNHSRVPRVICTGISDYFNLYPSSGKGSLSMIQSPASILAPPAKKSRLNNEVSPMQSSCKASVDPDIQVSEVLTVFQEIPTYGLAPDDVLKVISTLSHDDGRRFKSLLKLPMCLKKDWLLMEIKASKT